MLCHCKQWSLLGTEEFWKTQAERIFHTNLSSPPAGTWKSWVMHPSNYAAGPWDMINFEKREISSDEMLAKLDKLSKYVRGKLIFEQKRPDGSRHATHFREAAAEGLVTKIEGNEAAIRFEQLQEEPDVQRWLIWNYNPLVM